MRQLFPIDLWRRSAVIGAFLFFSIGLCGLSPALAAGVPMMLPNSEVLLTVETAGGGKAFSIEVADDPTEREKGLMFRRSMGDNHGMLFVFPGEGEIGFWMKDTPMALDMLFIGSDGKIRAIRQGVPFSRETVSPGVPVQFVLELKAGTAKKNGIAVGDRIHHPAIDGSGSKDR